VLGLSTAILSYLIGSFPTAYVIGKRARNIDISRSGSGNIGARNAYEVTGSKSIGISVGAIDILKGFIVTLVSTNAFGLAIGLTAAFFVVLGHNYSIFMKFKGGRGLATGAGALLVLQPLTVPVYLATYFVFRKLGLGLYLASVLAIGGAFLVLVLEVSPDRTAMALSAALAGAVLSKHIIPLRDEFRNA
jgi:acyl phosphate:glycerol-3-phosphate acyltransferase